MSPLAPAGWSKRLGVDFMHDIEVVEFGEFTDEGMKWLSAADQLETLTISTSGVGDQGMD